MKLIKGRVFRSPLRILTNYLPLTNQNLSETINSSDVLPYYAVSHKSTTGTTHRSFDSQVPITVCRSSGVRKILFQEMNRLMKTVMICTDAVRRIYLFSIHPIH